MQMGNMKFSKPLQPKQKAIKDLIKYFNKNHIPPGAIFSLIGSTKDNKEWNLSSNPGHHTSIGYQIVLTPFGIDAKTNLITITGPSISYSSLEEFLSKDFIGQYYIQVFLSLLWENKAIEMQVWSSHKQIDFYAAGIDNNTPKVFLKNIKDNIYQCYWLLE
jgi:hypothetical protein